MNTQDFLHRLAKLPIHEQWEVLRVFQQKKYRDSLYLTAKKLLGYKEINDRTHGDLIRALESDCRRSLICMPRGTFKSSIASVALPIWLLIRNPNERILIDSELYTNSKNYLREVKGHLIRPELTSIFGVFKDDSNWNEGEATIKQRTKVFKEASLTAGGIGTEKTGQHYTTIICDDLNSPNNSGTEEGIEKVLNHFRMMTSILEPDGKIVLIGTRYHERDCIGMVLHDIINEEGK